MGTCNVVDLDNFNRLCPQDTSNFNVLSLNMRSVRNENNSNFDELIVHLSQVQVTFSAIVLCETFLYSDENPPSIDGYTAFSVSRDRNLRHRGGGVVVYVLSSLTSTRIDNMSSIFTSFESIGVEITSGTNNTIQLFGVYRPPYCNLNDFNDEFFQMAMPYMNNKKCMVVGDFNVNTLDLSSVLACQIFF